MRALSGTTIVKRVRFTGGAVPRNAVAIQPANATAASNDTATSGTLLARRSPRPILDAAANVVLAYEGFASASANAFALSNRSAGSFSSDRATAAATFGGTDLRKRRHRRAPPR